MVVRTYGRISFVPNENKWSIQEAEPHVRMKLKSVFENIRKTQVPPYDFVNTPERCADLHWFIQRYPLTISHGDKIRLSKQNKLNTDHINELESLMLKKYKPHPVKLKKGEKARKYQLSANDLFDKMDRLLNGDEIGLGKTLTAILAMLNIKRLPAIVVCQTHLQTQWRKEVERFTNLNVHCIKGTKPYDLPEADVYIIKYSCLAGWSNMFQTNYFKYAVFDECQELRTGVSEKCKAALLLSQSVQYCQGLSATPILNYGSEIYAVMKVIKPGCLGTSEEFHREWTDGKQVKDPVALGAYLRHNFVLLRRTRAEVKMELPAINTIVNWVEADEDSVHSEVKLAQQLAMRIFTGSFHESGEAAREFDMRLRKLTGVAKAHAVAVHVKMLVEAGESVLLAGWHRDVYDIWLKDLAAYKPAMYTGTESPKEKEESRRRFMAGETKVMIMSLRSGAGVDGLQHHCRFVVVGELDYSPKVHQQFIGRVDRPGNDQQVTAMYIVTDFGCDPSMIEINGLKSSQSHGIVDPFLAPAEQFSDTSKMKEIARRFLEANGIKIPDSKAA
jgi:SNF2 family DNA or RNA helicase